ncbi:class I SAM-dependent methyltransferase [Pseudoalteromonas luteoviolacea]|uniref:class I SAM-dependent methyltransferase n=1 Tax=Pseudoalteromonas luteoviolacea TaxID=43657 RepID=UPI001B3879B2|nr:class I SAM-dependent methyltransferase [Pseudoalteromonas luteoviolacea]MBQ4811583.1 class I SAM-dependent methyltransferase [Pseudoalteromonas luteoviolacea]
MCQTKIQFVEAVNKLLNSEKGAITKSEMKAMVAYLGEVTQVFTDTDMNDSQKAQTACGVAISPVQAAKCFEETIRTQMFAQGVAKAISDKLTAAIKPIRILYAGTGPYATLLLPLLAASTEQLPLEITLLDIHKENIAAVEALITHFGLEGYHIELVHGDATQWRPKSEQQYFDIIISETMTALLKREPQVFIFKHLVQYLQADGVLIPERVSLRTWLTPQSKQAGPDVFVGEFFCLDKSRAQELNKGDEASFCSELTIPEGNWAEHVVKLTTDILVYRQLSLHEGDCSLNIAFTFSPYDAVLTSNKPIVFKYVQPDSPDFSVVFPKPEWKQANFELPQSSDTGTLGLVQIKRAFQRAYLIKRGERVVTPEQEWQGELCLYDALSLNVREIMSKMYELERFSDFETWLLERVGPLDKEQLTAINQQCLEKITDVAL